MPDPLKVEKDAFNDNVILPKIGQAADKLVSFLIGEGIQFSTDQEDTTDIDALWQANREALLLHNLALSGTLGGHVFTRIEPRENDFPRIVNLNPQNSSVFWDVSDIGRVLWYRLQFQVSEQGPGKRVDYVNGALAGDSFDHSVTDQWWEVTWTTKGGFRPEWLQYGAPVKWPYSWSPIVEWQNLPAPVQLLRRVGRERHGAAERSIELRGQQLLPHPQAPRLPQDGRPGLRRRRGDGDGGRRAVHGEPPTLRGGYFQSGDAERPDQLEGVHGDAE